MNGNSIAQRFPNVFSKFSELWIHQQLRSIVAIFGPLSRVDFTRTSRFPTEATERNSVKLCLKFLCESDLKMGVTNNWRFPPVKYKPPIFHALLRWNISTGIFGKKRATEVISFKTTNTVFQNLVTAHIRMRSSRGFWPLLRIDFTIFGYFRKDMGYRKKKQETCYKQTEHRTETAKCLLHMLKIWGT